MISIEEAKTITKKALEVAYLADIKLFREKIEADIDALIRAAASNGKRSVYFSIGFCSYPNIQRLANIRDLITATYVGYAISFHNSNSTTEVTMSW